MDFINYNFNNLNLNKTIKFYTYDDRDGVSGVILKNNIWESKNTKIFMNILKNNDLYFVDIGCNLGWFSIISSLLNNKTVSFEAFPETYYLFSKTNNENKLNIDIRNRAISNKKKIINFSYHIKKNEPLYTLNSKYKNVSQINLLDSSNISELIKGDNIIFNTYDKNIDHKLYFSVGINIQPNYIWKEINNYNELVLKINIRANNIKTIGKKIKFYNGINYIVNDTELTHEFKTIIFICSFDPKNFLKKNRIGIVDCSDSMSIEINNFEYEFQFNKEKIKNEIIELDEHYNYGGNHIVNDSKTSTIQVEANTLDNELININHNMVLKIDIEGHEPEAIEGMSKILKKNLINWIIFEFSPNFNNNKLLDMCKTLIKNGFLIIPINRINNTNYSDLLINIKQNHININDIEEKIKNNIQEDFLCYKNDS